MILPSPPGQWGGGRGGRGTGLGNAIVEERWEEGEVGNAKRRGIEVEGCQLQSFRLLAGLTGPGRLQIYQLPVLADLPAAGGGFPPVT